MNSYGKTMLGNFVCQKVATLPAWSSAAEGKLIYVEDSNKLYYGDDSRFIESSGIRTIHVQPITNDTEVTTDLVQYFRVPSPFNGKILVRAQASVITAGTTNATTIQVRNMTKYASNDALSTAISIASGGTLGTVGTVNASYDDVSTDDLIRISVTGVSTTKPKGLLVVLEYV